MLTKFNKDNYVSILSSDGTLRMPVPEGTEGATVREYETSDGKKGVKHELVFNKLEGKITKVEFFDGEFGKLIQLTVTDDSGDVVLSVNTSQNYGEDLMKKLPNINFDLPVAFSPYSFEDDKGKVRKGISIVQNDNKIQNFFYDPVKQKNINGYPDPEPGKEYDKEDWKVYFIQARKFLVKYTEDNIIPKFPEAAPKTGNF